MKHKIMKKLVGLTCCFSLLLGSFAIVQAEEKITPTDIEYDVILKNAQFAFIGNEKPVKWKVGDKYFLTYTVDEVEENTTTQSGMVVTKDQKNVFPYTKGGMQYQTKSVLCEKGKTYFLRFEVTEKGMECIAAYGKGEKSEYIKLPYPFGDLTTAGPYFGVWNAEGTLSARLSHVRCYDAKGNNLGVYGNPSLGVTVFQSSKFEENKKVNHKYAFSLEKASMVAISNLHPAQDDVYYMEYTVKNVKAKDLTQGGGIMTNIPTAAYPHGEGEGYLNYSIYKKQSECKLLTEGAHYLFRFERKEDGFSVIAKRTLNGKTEYITHSAYFGKYHKESKYVAIWFGENCSLTADFANVKCYDSKGNNLGIQTNKKVKISHFGELEDYSQCEAVYYCKANNTFITLDDDCNASRRIDGEKSSDMGTYSVEDSVMTLQIGKNKEKLDYLYTVLVDKDKNQYERLKEVEVLYYSDETGKELLQTAKATAKNGFKAKMPKAPTQDGKTFAGWQTGDGVQYDFDSVVTETVSLYATWEGEDSWQIAKLLGIEEKEDVTPRVLLLCVLLAGVTLIGVVLTNRGKKNGKKAQNE